MSLGSLDLGAPPGGTLAFGAGGTSGPTPADLGIDAGLGEFTADLALGSGFAFSIDAGLGEFECDIEAAFYTPVSRPGARHGIRMHWQDGKRAAAAASTRWQDSAPVLVHAATRWQDGAATKSAAAVRWQDNTTVIFARTTRWQDASPLRAAIAQRWQETDRYRVALESQWQDASAVRHVTTVRWQEMRRLRDTVAARWQDATAVRRLHLEAAYDATPVRHFQRTHWQDARKPPPGRSWHTIPPEPPHLCYDPADLGKLQFGLDTSTLGVLAFWCKPDDPPVGGIVIPTLRVYMMDNNVSMFRLPDGKELEVFSVGYSLDAASWTWSLDAVMHPKHRTDIQRPVGGDPVRVRAVVNGHPVDFIVDELSQERTYQEASLRVTGRGLSAVLGAPFAPSHRRSFPTQRMASQLASDILTLNGVPFGWSVLWGMTDWLVPGNTWTPQGTYVDALTELASAAGGYVQPTPTTQELRFLRKYPVLPRNWGSSAPNFELPSSAVVVEGLTWVDKPSYNGVIVSGQRNGVEVTARTLNTAGDVQAAQVVHELITAVDAGRGRAEEILSDTGRQVRARLRTPIFTASGLILPGNLLRYTDGPDVKVGLVRSLAVEASYEESWQTLEVEIHE